MKSRFTIAALTLASLIAGLFATGAPPGRSPAEADRPDRGPSDRGDVPGWVLITVMTAALVVGLWALAGEAFTNFFQDAMNKVRGAG